MPSEFNPYQALLKINCSQRPDHYALLGVAVFESDVEAIETAAERRLLFLQNLANSEHLDASQKLLNEVAAARRCLLSPHDKIACDEGLRRQQEKLAAGKARSKKKPRSKPAKDGTTQDPQPKRRQKKKSSVNMMTLILLAAVGVLVLILVLSSGNSSGQTNLVLDWPLSEREGATLLIDSKAVTIRPVSPQSC